MKRNLFLFTLLFTMCTILSAQLQNSDVWEFPEMKKNQYRRLISIPDVNGFKVVKCDFHVHTFFSDGDVSPVLRVEEAWTDGLDAIAITDHLEYKKYKEIVRADDNESYKLAQKRAQNIGLTLIKGTEITKSKPFGHMNALFIQDANIIQNPDGAKAMEAALTQGAFILWNHPGWPNDTSTLYPMHQQWLSDKKIHGVEVFNDTEMYHKAIEWCNKYNIAIIGNTDIHGIIKMEYGEALRPMTLVFAKSTSSEDIREAMFAQRTAAFFNNQLVGQKTWMQQLVLSSLQVKRIEKSIQITNISDIPFQIKNGKRLIFLPARTTTQTSIDSNQPLTFVNVWIGEFQNLTLPVSEITEQK